MRTVIPTPQVGNKSHTGTRLTQYLMGSSVKTPTQWEAAVENENKNKTETTERIRLHIEGTESRILSYFHFNQHFASHSSCWSDYFLPEVYGRFRIREGD